MNKHLEFYNQCMETGRLPQVDQTGLCGSAAFGFISSALLKIFEPTHEDELELEKERVSIGWWASGVSGWDDSIEDIKEYGFTELRQTIVAFMAIITLEDFEPEISE